MCNLFYFVQSKLHKKNSLICFAEFKEILILSEWSNLIYWSNVCGFCLFHLLMIDKAFGCFLSLSVVHICLLSFQRNMIYPLPLLLPLWNSNILILRGIMKNELFVFLPLFSCIRQWRLKDDTTLHIDRPHPSSIYEQKILFIIFPDWINFPSEAKLFFSFYKSSHSLLTSTLPSFTLTFLCHKATKSELSITLQ